MKLSREYRTRPLNAQRRGARPLASIVVVLWGTMASAAPGAVETGLDATYQYGEIRGFLQTPAGGRPGTTSSKRPSFAELGLDRVSVFDAALRVARERHVLAGGLQLIRLDRATTLTRELTSQNSFFPAGDRVQSDVKLDWYRFGYRYRLGPTRRAAQKHRFAVGGDLVAFDFHYQLDGTGHVDLSYMKIGTRLGGTWDWQISEPWSAAAQAFWPVPLSNTPSILSVALGTRYRFYRSSRAAVHATFGLAYTLIDYEDEQDVPNHIRAEMGPLFWFGVGAEF